MSFNGNKWINVCEEILQKLSNCLNILIKIQKTWFNPSCSGLTQLATKLHAASHSLLYPWDWVEILKTKIYDVPSANVNHNPIPAIVKEMNSTPAKPSTFLYVQLELNGHTPLRNIRFL